jgi:NAD(P)-dependent dehydrogenase (short-subunit alcohol dehydrogenase family)
MGQNAGVDAMDLTGSIVIVTGASSGIGAATARLLHEAGGHPVLAARRADRIEALGQELGGALAVPTDVTDAAAIRHLAGTVLDRHGRIDGLVNNAGVSLHGPLDQLDLDEFARVLDLNVISVMAMTQAVLPAMRAQGAGRIVNISSGTTRMARVAGGAVDHGDRVRGGPLPARPFHARPAGAPGPDPAPSRVRRPGHPAGAAHGRRMHRHPAWPRAGRRHGDPRKLTGPARCAG